MALILIRGENNSKLLNEIADMERHGNLNLATKPKIIDAKFADSLVEKILNSKLRTISKVATAFFVKEDITLSIMQIKKIHPPALYIRTSYYFFLSSNDSFPPHLLTASQTLRKPDKSVLLLQH